MPSAPHAIPMNIRITKTTLVTSDTTKNRPDLPQEILMGLAAREFAGKLTAIEHLNVTPDLLGNLLGDLARAGTRHLAQGDADPRG